MTEADHPSEELVRAVRRAGVSDERLFEAVRATPRAAFVPTGHRAHAYHDAPLAIGHGQVTTQPSLSAMMIEGLELSGDEHVLEIGTGLGFQTALLARLAADVVTIEMSPDLAHQARRNLARQGVRNVELRIGDGSGGVPDGAPYDAVIVSAAFPEVPAPLVEQLRCGGRLVQPIGPGGREQVVSFLRTATGLERRRVLAPAHFVRLRGQRRRAQGLLTPGPPVRSAPAGAGATASTMPRKRPAACSSQSGSHPC